MINLIKRKYFTLDECNITNEKLAEHIVVSYEPEELAVFLIYFRKHFKHNWIIYEDVPYSPWSGEVPDPEPSQTKIDIWCDKFGSIFNLTYDRYNTLLNLYETQKANLLNKIGSTSEVRYNDTPQDSSELIDGYTTNVTRTKSEADPNELILRLKNIENNYSDVIKNWLFEFYLIFGEEV